jgi:hypothetical protein
VTERESPNAMTTTQADRRVSILCAALAALSPALAAALDAPHDQTFSDGACANCHSLYVTSGPSGDPDYTLGCLTCHNARPSSRFGFPWQTGDQATPGVSGSHHSWSGYGANPKAGAHAPGSGVLQKQLVDGRLQCSVCHDPHHSASENSPGKQHTSIAVGTAVNKTGGTAGGTGMMTLVAAGSTAKAYRVQIQTADASGGTFILSHDFGLATPSWFNWVGSAWVAGTATGPGKAFTNGADVALDDPAVTVRFGAGAVAGNTWDFWVSYPFLRAPMTDDAFCISCHDERNQQSARVRGADLAYLPNGVRRFSHPVGEALNSNGLGRDRTPLTMLDATGVAQAAGDGNASNDLVMPGGLVGCTSCHAAHGADSNSLSADPLR